MHARLPTGAPYVGTQIPISEGLFQAVTLRIGHFHTVQQPSGPMRHVRMLYPPLGDILSDVAKTVNIAGWRGSTSQN